MSIRQGKKLIASSATNGFNLFDCKWADHILNNISWLRADTFSWQSGDVYVAAYQHLADDINGKTLQSETIGDTTIQFYLADDGHKICPASEESNVSAIYNSTGVAWYYILDTTNRQFKLPRTKWGFTGIRSGVGGYVAPGLPDHNHKIIINTKWGSKSNNNGPNWCGDDATRATNVAATSTNASQSNSIYGASDTVQPPATQMYLYFYVGNFEQSAIEQTAGLNAEMFNDLNAHKVIEFQAPTSTNGYTWYRKYADGWVEQGGVFDAPNNTAGVEKTITLPLPMTNDKYTITIGVRNTTNDYNVYLFVATKTSTTITFKCNISNVALADQNWQVSGMSA